MRKERGSLGISTLLSAVLIVAIGVTLTVIVSNWLTTNFRERSEDIRDTAKTKLDCQFADLYVRNVTYNCNSNCAAGTSHTMTITIVNSGKKAVSVRDVNFLNTSGALFTFELNGTKELNSTDVLTASNVSTTECNSLRNATDKVIVVSTTCPRDAVDSFPGSDVSFQSC